MGKLVSEESHGKAPKGVEAHAQDVTLGHGSLERGLDARKVLSHLSPLDSSALMHRRIPCKICGDDSDLFDRVDFNKYCNSGNFYEFGFANVNVDYHRCRSCGFLFTTLCDDWTAEDFGKFIYNKDYLKVDSEYLRVRPLHVGTHFARRLSGAEDARILDYGSGAGVFEERLRAGGFTQIQSYDPFSSPARPSGTFDIITCFEVIEHSIDPRATLRDIISYLRPNGCVLFSQTIQPPDILSLRGSWWYLAPRNGHVSTFTEECFEILGRELGLMFYRGDTVFAYAGPAPGRLAQIALASIGPSYATLRLFAPSVLPDSMIVSHDKTLVAWHPITWSGGRRVRWTGDFRCLTWRARWTPVSRLRVHIPLVEAASPALAAACAISLDGVEKPVQMVRGDLTAEFEVEGKTQGSVMLITPAPLPLSNGSSGGVAIAVHEAQARRLMQAP